MNNHKIRRTARRTEPSCHSRISKIHERRDRGGGGGEGSSGLVDENGKLLLEIQVTKSLCAGMSRSIGRARDGIEDEKGHVEVTIVRPILTSGESSRSNELSQDDAPAVTLDRYEAKNLAAVPKSSEARAEGRTSRWGAVPSLLRRSIDAQRQQETKSKLSKSSDTGQQRPPPRNMESERVSTIGNVSSVETSTSDNNEAILESPPTLIELGALHKVLDRLRPNDLESTSAWYSSEPCCREIVQRFQNLLREWASDRERLDRCTLMDHTLTKCQNCGVIRCSEVTQPRDCTVQAEYREKIIAERKTDSRSIGTTTDICESNVTKLVKNSFGDKIRYRSEKVIGSRETIAPKIKRIPVSNARISSGTTIVRAVERGTTANGISKIVDPAIDEIPRMSVMPIKNRDKGVDTSRTQVEKPGIEACHGRWVDKNRMAKNVSLMETLLCPGRDNFDIHKEAPSRSFVEKPKKLGRELFREDTFKRKRSFDLYGSRDVDFHRNWNFLSSDGESLRPERENVSGNKPKPVAKTIILGSFDTSRQSVNFSECSDARSRVHGSDESSFGSSSAENFIQEWMKSGCRIEPKDNEIQSEDFSHDIRAGISSYDMRNVTARMTEAIQKYANRSTSLEDDPFHAASNIGSVQCSDQKRSVKVDDTVTIARRAKIEPPELSRISKRVSEAIWKGCMKDRVNVGVSVFTEVPSKVNKKDSDLTDVSSRHLDRPDVSIQNFERFERQILYDEVSSRDAISRESLTTSVTATKVLPLYRKIIESNEKMDWESFERLVTVLHPGQRELWCDICNAVSNEAKRIANETGATTEVCIEINPRAGGNEADALRLPYDDEITFELDMTLRDIGGIFGASDRPFAFDGTREGDKRE